MLLRSHHTIDVCDLHTDSILGRRHICMTPAKFHTSHRKKELIQYKCRSHVGQTVVEWKCKYTFEVLQSFQATFHFFSTIFDSFSGQRMIFLYKTHRAYKKCFVIYETTQQYIQVQSTNQSANRQKINWQLSKKLFFMQKLFMVPASQSWEFAAFSFNYGNYFFTLRFGLLVGLWDLE